MSLFRSKLVKTNVTVVKFYKNYILAGIGGSCHIYNKSDLSQENQLKIFEGHAIYGIECQEDSDKLLVYGANVLKIFEWKDVSLRETCSKFCNDWVLTAKFIDNNENVAYVSMHNRVTLMTSDLTVVQTVTCKERCISYCATILYDKWDELIILSGTVFTEVLVWQTRNEKGKLCEVKARLKGHKGVIFSIEYNYTTGIICSTSDDRSAILWCSKSGDVLQEVRQNNPSIELKSKLFAHSARVFRCKLLEDYVLTAGEDSMVFIWDMNGKIIRKIEAHQGDSIWALDCSKDDNILITGGGDCAITIFPLITDILETKINVDAGIPKKIQILNSNNIAVVTSCGKLCYYDSDKQKWTQIIEHADLKSYALLEVSPCGNLIALAGYTGNIYLYKETQQMLQLVNFYQTDDKGRIYSLHFLRCSLMLVCGPEGKLTLLNLEKDDWKIENEFCLPVAKERWSTSACIVTPLHYAVGDRKGHIYLYRDGRIEPLQVVKNAHNYMGVTNLYYSENELISLGRNSTIKRFSFFKEKLALISSDKLPFSWLILYEEKLNLLIGFSGSNLIVWDYISRRILLEKDCGGGHRSWAFKKTKQLDFMYLKDKYINKISTSWSNLKPVDVVSGYHVKEINSISVIELKPHENEYLVISGGEDTTLRFSHVDKTGKFNVITVLKHHLSSIRTIDTLLYNEKLFVFSAGGRAQIIVWELCFKNKVFNCIEKFSFYEANAEVSEVRIMDIKAIVMNEKVYVICACSDGNIKIYSMSENGMLCFIKSIFYKLNCILKVHVIELCEKFILISTATDGNVVFWNLTNLLKYTKVESSEMPLTSIKCHQSSINSIASLLICENKYIILTGGDDNAFNLLLIEFSANLNNINVFDTFHNYKEHCAHITGVYITNDYLLTTSIDQSVILFKWCVENNKIACDLTENYNSAVADLQGTVCFERKDEFSVFIHGKGLELLNVHKT